MSIPFCGKPHERLTFMLDLRFSEPYNSGKHRIFTVHVQTNQFNHISAAKSTDLYYETICRGAQMDKERFLRACQAAAAREPYLKYFNADAAKKLRALLDTALRT